MKNIEARWAAQLLKEHRDISWRHGISLTSPTINISSGEKTLGSWSDQTRVLSISSHLIENEVWDVVLEVLKHEMAHQYVCEFYGSADSHGKYFKKACSKLGVHPAFIKSGINYPQKLQLFKGELPADAQKLLQRVEKLMALGQSSNVAEAQSATKKANYLLNKYNLERTNSQNDDPDIKYLTICHKKKRIQSIQRAILSILGNYYHVNCITSNTYHVQDDTVYKSIVLVGKNASLKIAEYVYCFLLDMSQTLWQDFKCKNNARRKEKISFEMGFIAGIEHNHKMMSEDASLPVNKHSTLPAKTIQSLLKTSRRENQKELSRLFPKLKSVKFGRHQASSRAFKDGLKNGRNTRINKPMTHRKKKAIALLQH